MKRNVNLREWFHETSENYQPNNIGTSILSALR
jgi:hypothetical protein